MVYIKIWYLQKPMIVHTAMGHSWQKKHPSNINTLNRCLLCHVFLWKSAQNFARIWTFHCSDIVESMMISCCTPKKTVNLGWYDPMTWVCRLSICESRYTHVCSRGVLDKNSILVVEMIQFTVYTSISEYVETYAWNNVSLTYSRSTLYKCYTKKMGIPSGPQLIIRFENQKKCRA